MPAVRKGIVLGVVAAAVLFAGAVAGGVYLYRTLRTPPDIHKVGGTLLLFEVDEDDERSADFRPDDLADALRRRLDPSGRRGITVRSIGRTRVEVGVPRTEAHDDDLRQVKALAAQTGRLEFRILANSADDEEGIAAAEKLLRRAADDAALRQDLDRRARRGQPPPGPARKDGFVGPKGHLFDYSWLELSPAMLRTLRLLDDDGEGESAETYRRQREAVAAARARGEAVSLTVPDLLLYSRPCRDEGLTEAERRDKRFDWFVLGRDPERDAVTGASKAVTGDYLELATVARDGRGRPAVQFRLNKEGGDLFYELTSQNKPEATEDGFARQMAIVLDGRILMAPQLRSAIRDSVEIAGDFTAREVENLAIILRAGSLPARLKPRPVAEQVVEPGAAPASW